MADATGTLSRDGGVVVADAAGTQSRDGGVVVFVVVVVVVVVVVATLVFFFCSVHMLTTFSVLGSFFSLASSLNLLSLP